jgi:hypothetical protein
LPGTYGCTVLVVRVPFRPVDPITAVNVALPLDIVVVTPVSRGAVTEVAVGAPAPVFEPALGVNVLISVTDVPLAPATTTRVWDTSLIRVVNVEVLVVPEVIVVEALSDVEPADEADLGLARVVLENVAVELLKPTELVSDPVEKDFEVEIDTMDFVVGEIAEMVDEDERMVELYVDDAGLDIEIKDDEAGIEDVWNDTVSGGVDEGRVDVVVVPDTVSTEVLVLGEGVLTGGKNGAEDELDKEVDPVALPAVIAARVTPTDTEVFVIVEVIATAVPDVVVSGCCRGTITACEAVGQANAATSG